MSDRMPAFDVDDYRLVEIAVEEYCGFVFVHLGDDPRSMDESYPGLRDAIAEVHSDPGSLRLERDTTFDIAGNWKNVADNLLECYHCHPAHKAFVDLIDMAGYRNETFNGWSVQSGPAGPGNGVYDVSSGAPGFVSTFVWPNVEISLRSRGYHQGKFICIPDRPEISEHAVHHFHSMVLHALRGTVPKDTPS